MSDPKRIKWVIECLQGETLSGWEQSFVDSVQRQFESKGTLSEAQCAKLEEIHEAKQ
jgi:hypothetical protein